MKLEGNVHKYGSDVNTDVIIPARYLRTMDSASLVRYCMRDIDDTFATRMERGDFIVAEDNFGCGSSREQAPRVIKDSGIACVIAASFARIFFRNAINIGLAILESPEASEATQMGDRITVDLSTGTVQNLTRDMTFKAAPYPKFMQEIIDAGGLIAHTRKRLKEKK